jgi:hypothetical protein
MDLSESFDAIFRQNPYLEELSQLLRTAKNDPYAAPKLLASFHEKLAGDVELERKMMLGSRVVSLNLNPHSPSALSEARGVIEEFFDISARRQLWGLAFSGQSDRVYIDFLDQQRKLDAQHWEHVTLTMGDDTVEMILDGRVAYWTLAAKAQTPLRKEQRSALTAFIASPASVSRSPSGDSDEKAATGASGTLGRPPLGEVDGALVKSLRGTQTQPQFVRNLDISVDVLQKAENGLASERTIDILFACKAAKALKLKRESFYKNPPQKTA